MDARRRSIALGLFALAVAIRVVFVLQYRANPLFDQPIIDALTYHEWALRIASGEGLGDGAFTRAPLYSIFLAGIYKLAGIGAQTPPLDLLPGGAAAARAILAAKLAQATLGGATALLTCVAGFALFGTFAGAAAGLVVALHPVLIFYSGELFGETLATFLTIAAFAALALARGRAPRTTIALHLAAGVALGLSAITRPTILLVAPLVALAVLLLDWRQSGARRALTHALVLAAGLAATIAPVTLRNFREGGGFVLISSQGGVTLWMGNNADADGRSARSPGRGRTATGAPAADIIDVAARQIAEEDAKRQLTAAEVSDYWGGKAKSWAAANPGAFAKLTLTKFAYFCGGAEIWDQQCDVDFLSRFSPVVGALLVAQPISLPTGLIMPFALLGILLVARDLIERDAAARRGAALLLAFFVPYVGGVLMFFFASRYRLPLLPLLALFAAIALERLIAIWRSSPPRRALLHTLPLALLAVLVNLNARYPNPLYESRARVFVANAFIESGEPARAIPHLEEAMQIEPRAADPHYALGLARLAQSDNAGAQNAFEAALARDPGFERAAINLANLRAQAGEWEEAIRLYGDALTLMQGDAMILENLAIVAQEAGRGGRADLAERALVRILAERPGDANALNALAWNLAERQGRAREAVPIAERALAAAPASAEALDTLGWALVLAGDAAAAVPRLRAARAALPENPDVALHLGVALALADGGRPSRDESAALLAEAFSSPGGDARRARADSLLRR
ncbi:MAG: tetratricopeptide repeat protein [bacterium]